MDIARNKALCVLIEYEKSGVFPNLSLKKHLRDISDGRDKGFVSALVYGVIEKKRLLDYYISCVSSVKIKKINVAVINILRMGLYQMMFLSTPVSAACNTSVDLAKKNGQFKSAAFVNAVLRKLSTSYKEIEMPEDFSIRYSLGDSVCDKLLEIFDTEQLVSFLESASDDNDLTVAVNTCKVTPDELISLFKLEGITASHTRFDSLVRLSGILSIENSAAFKSGLYHVIGLSSYCAAHSLSPLPGDKVIDMCAAPGGKTFAMAYISADNTDITAFDVHEHKVKNLNQDCKRLGLNSVSAYLSDSTVFSSEYSDSADKILCDVPCSGLGMILKKPDIKYNEIDFDSLIAIQYKILSNAGKYLKSGGRIVYSTCTINPDENFGVVKRFLENNPQFKIDESVEIFDGNFGQHTFLPHIDHTDGFYVAVLKKD